MSAIDDAWNLARSGGPVDADRLFVAVTDETALTSRDIRTRMLVRDALQGLRAFWTPAAFDARMRRNSQFARVSVFLSEPADDDGFPTLRERLMTPTDPQTAIQMFRDLGRMIGAEASLVVGGSLALMFDAILVRHTDDIDVVDELPDPLRREHELLAQTAKRYGLKLAHFQSHYLPDGWSGRTESLGRFGRLEVHVVDPIDVLTGKLFSKRTKDLDDVRMAMPKIDAAVFRQRIATSTDAFRRDAGLLAAAKQNWYIVTGEEDLPS